MTLKKKVTCGVLTTSGAIEQRFYESDPIQFDSCTRMTTHINAHEHAGYEHTRLPTISSYFTDWQLVEVMRLRNRNASTKAKKKKAAS